MEKITAYYYRSATKTEDISNSQQMKELLNHITKNDVNSYIILVDDGQPGTIMMRPVFKHLLTLMRMEALDKIIVTDVARISRNPLYASTFLNEANEYNVPVETVEGNILTKPFFRSAMSLVSYFSELAELAKDTMPVEFTLNHAWIYGNDDSDEPIGEKNFVISSEYLCSIFDEMFPDAEDLDDFLDCYEPETDGERIYQRALKDNKVLAEKDTLYSEVNYIE